jgi:acyl dehydratase
VSGSGFGGSHPEVGDVRREVVVSDLTRTQIVQYAGASGDFNPVHTDEVFATQVAGYPSVFAHGMLTMALTAKAVTNFIGDGTLTEYGVRFRRQVWPGDSLTTTLQVVGLDDATGTIELAITTTNQSGDVVLEGTAVANTGTA